MDVAGTGQGGTVPVVETAIYSVRQMSRSRFIPFFFQQNAELGHNVQEFQLVVGLQVSEKKIGNVLCLRGANPLGLQRYKKKNSRKREG